MTSGGNVDRGDGLRKNREQECRTAPWTVSTRFKTGCSTLPGRCTLRRKIFGMRADGLDGWVGSELWCV